MKSKHELLAIALGGPKGDSESDDEDMEYGAEHDDSSDDKSEEPDEHDSVAAARDFMDALSSKDPQALVDAFRALSVSADKGG